jgi:hypothetical protein
MLVAFTPTYAALAELDANSGVPQISQKSRLAMLPLSAVFS